MKNPGSPPLKQTLHFYREIALFLSLLQIFFQSLPPLYAQAVPAASAPSISTVDNIRIPSNIGKLEEVFKGSSDKTVILVQDAHAVPEAQRNIRNLIDYFQQIHALRTVALEGVSSRLNPQMFRSFPDPSALKKILGVYLERGELSGAAIAAIFNEKEGVYEGVEDWPLYEEGYFSFLQSLGHSSLLFEKLKAWEEALTAEKDKHYSKELRHIDEQLSSFSKNKADLLQVLHALKSVLPPPPGSELELMIQEAGHENKENVSVDLEVKRMAELIRKYLEAPGVKRDLLMSFNEKFQKYRLSEMRAEEFAIYLKEIIQSEGLKIDISKNLGQRMRREKRMRDIEGTRFFDAFEAYAASVKSKLIQNDEEKKLENESSLFMLIEKLASLELTRRQWETLKERETELAGLVRAGISSEADLRWHLEFYRNAERRDAALYENLMELTGRRDDGLVLMVSGGFHTEGLVSRLREENVSYVLLMPAIDSLPDEIHYKQHMRGQVSWKDYFEVKDGRLNVYQAFVRSTRDKLLELHRGERGVLLKAWRDQILRDLAAQGRIAEAVKYTRYIDETVHVKATALNNQNAELLGKVEDFVQDLKQLRATDNFTEQNILRLIQPSGIPAAASYLAVSEDPMGLTFQVTVSAATGEIQLSENSKRSELRVLPARGRSSRQSEFEAAVQDLVEAVDPESFDKGLLKIALTLQQSDGSTTIIDPERAAKISAFVERFTQGEEAARFPYFAHSFFKYFFSSVNLDKKVGRRLQGRRDLSKDDILGIFFDEILEIRDPRELTELFDYARELREQRIDFFTKARWKGARDYTRGIKSSKPEEIHRVEDLDFGPIPLAGEALPAAAVPQRPENQAAYTARLVKNIPVKITTKATGAFEAFIGELYKAAQANPQILTAYSAFHSKLMKSFEIRSLGDVEFAGGIKGTGKDNLNLDNFSQIFYYVTRFRAEDPDSSHVLTFIERAAALEGPALTASFINDAWAEAALTAAMRPAERVKYGTKISGLSLAEKAGLRNTLNGRLLNESDAFRDLFIEAKFRLYEMESRIERARLDPLTNRPVAAKALPGGQSETIGWLDELAALNFSESDTLSLMERIEAYLGGVAVITKGVRSNYRGSLRQIHRLLMNESKNPARSPGALQASLEDLSLRLLQDALTGIQDSGRAKLLVQDGTPAGWINLADGELARRRNGAKRGNPFLNVHRTLDVSLGGTPHRYYDLETVFPGQDEIYKGETPYRDSAWYNLLADLNLDVSVFNRLYEKILSLLGGIPIAGGKRAAASETGILRAVERASLNIEHEDFTAFSQSGAVSLEAALAGIESKLRTLSDAEARRVRREEIQTFVRNDVEALLKTAFRGELSEQLKSEIQQFAGRLFDAAAADPEILPAFKSFLKGLVEAFQKKRLEGDIFVGRFTAGGDNMQNFRRIFRHLIQFDQNNPARRDLPAFIKAANTARDEAGRTYYELSDYNRAALDLWASGHILSPLAGIELPPVIQNQIRPFSEQLLRESASNQNIVSDFDAFLSMLAASQESLEGKLLTLTQQERPEINFRKVLSDVLKFRAGTLSQAHIPLFIARVEEERKRSGLSTYTVSLLNDAYTNAVVETVLSRYMTDQDEISRAAQTIRRLDQGVKTGPNDADVLRVPFQETLQALSDRGALQRRLDPEGKLNGGELVNELLRIREIQIRDRLIPLLPGNPYIVIDDQVQRQIIFGRLPDANLFFENSTALERLIDGFYIQRENAAPLHIHMPLGILLSTTGRALKGEGKYAGLDKADAFRIALGQAYESLQQEVLNTLRSQRSNSQYRLLNITARNVPESEVPRLRRLAEAIDYWNLDTASGRAYTGYSVPKTTNSRGAPFVLIDEKENGDVVIDLIPVDDDVVSFLTEEILGVAPQAAEPAEEIGTDELPALTKRLLPYPLSQDDIFNFLLDRLQDYRSVLTALQNNRRPDAAALENLASYINTAIQEAEEDLNRPEDNEDGLDAGINAQIQAELFQPKTLNTEAELDRLYRRREVIQGQLDGLRRIESALADRKTGPLIEALDDEFPLLFDDLVSNLTSVLAGNPGHMMLGQDAGRAYEDNRMPESRRYIGALQSLYQQNSLSLGPAQLNQLTAGLVKVFFQENMTLLKTGRVSQREILGRMTSFVSRKISGETARGERDTIASYIAGLAYTSISSLLANAEIMERSELRAEIAAGGALTEGVLTEDPNALLSSGLETLVESWTGQTEITAAQGRQIAGNIETAGSALTDSELFSVIETSAFNAIREYYTGLGQAIDPEFAAAFTGFILNNVTEASAGQRMVLGLVIHEDTDARKDYLEDILGKLSAQIDRIILTERGGEFAAVLSRLGINIEPLRENNLRRYNPSSLDQPAVARLSSGEEVETESRIFVGIGITNADEAGDPFVEMASAAVQVAAGFAVARMEKADLLKEDTRNKLRGEVLKFIFGEGLLSVVPGVQDVILINPDGSVHVNNSVLAGLMTDRAVTEYVKASA